MRITEPSIEILGIGNYGGTCNSSEEFIEKCGRICYKSESNITKGTSQKFMENLMKRTHLSVIEHCGATVKFICDRGVSHELVRHRLASFSQESTRYCNYKGGVEYILPFWLRDEVIVNKDILVISDGYVKGCTLSAVSWLTTMIVAEDVYQELLKLEWSPQQARSVLPNSLKTEIVMTANLREWYTILQLRTQVDAHPQMQQIMRPLLTKFKEIAPEIFKDIEYDNGINIADWAKIVV